MEVLLSKITQQAMNYAIRSGITITSGYAIQQCSRLLKTVKGNEKEELLSLQSRLESKIRIISPAIDMIELIAARGNTSLESALSLTKDLRWEIQSLGQRLAQAANDEELLRKGSSKSKNRAQTDLELKLIISAIRKLLERIEDAVPLINLAITTSGASLSTTLPASISPSRLLQASTLLTAGDSRYSSTPGQIVQIGPTFTLSMYMLFAGHAYRPHNDEAVRETTWKEAIHKARVKLLRVPLEKVYELPSTDVKLFTNGGEGVHQAQHLPASVRADEFAYQLLIVEDLDDDRVHTFEETDEQPGPFEDVALAGVREVLPIHEISKIFYADTGKILNIGSDGETNSPVVLLKRDVNAMPPRRMMERQRSETEWYDDLQGETGSRRTSESNNLDDDQAKLEAQFYRESSAAPEEQEIKAPEKRDPWGLPPNLDPEWIAFEVYSEDPDTESEPELPSTEYDEDSSRPSRSSRQASADPEFISALSNLKLESSPSTTDERRQSKQLLALPKYTAPSPSPSIVPALSMTTGPIRTSLSLLEMLIRLTALQQFQQTSHLAINDELLNFFLEESSTHGAGGNSPERRKVRRDARRRVGFDPYDESPVKRRGEDYQLQRMQDLQHVNSPTAYVEPVGYDAYRDGTPPSVLPTSETSAVRPRHYHANSMPSSPSPVNRNLSQATTDDGHGHQRYGSPATPPASTKPRQAFLRTQSARSGRLSSPLGPGRSSSTLVSSPSEDAFEMPGAKR